MGHLKQKSPVNNSLIHDIELNASVV